jgi:biopolymer transport protein TolR
VRQRKSRSPRLISRVDASAFASVLVVLLFFFMLLVEPSQQRGTADLPKVGHPTSMPAANREDALIVWILRDGTIFFGKDRARPSDLPAQIRERVGRGAEKKIYIKADARVRYGTVVGVLDGVRSAGLEKVAFLVEQRQVQLPGQSASAPITPGPH